MRIIYTHNNQAPNFCKKFIPKKSNKIEALLAGICAANQQLLTKSPEKDIFEENFNKWEDETKFQSTNIYENSHFKNIVKMGESATPFIKEKISKAPSPIVHALDLIYPNVINYEGFVSLKEACDTWNKVLDGNNYSK